MGIAVGVSRAQLGALDRLIVVAREEGLYLAGGTAVAIRLGHRRSADLALFTPAHAPDMAALRARVCGALPDAKVIDVSDATLRIRSQGVPIDVVRYPYDLLQRPSAGPHGFPIARLPDLAAMKLAAVARRGLRRDFWDLYEIAHGGVSLRAATRAYLRRFGRHEPDLYPVVRSLTFFDDAEREPVLPRGMSRRRWTEIKAFFEREATRILR